jgi:hypothetical protein
VDASGSLISMPTEGWGELASQCSQSLVGCPAQLGEKRERVIGVVAQSIVEGRFVEFGVAVNNLTDERYIGGMLDEFTQRFVVGAPRSMSFTASLGF